MNFQAKRRQQKHSLNEKASTFMTLQAQTEAAHDLEEALLAGRRCRADLLDTSQNTFGLAKPTHLGWRSSKEYV